MIELTVSASKTYKILMAKGLLSSAGESAREALNKGGTAAASACGTAVTSHCGKAATSDCGTAATSHRDEPGTSDRPASCGKLCIITDAVVNELYGGETQPLWISLQSAGFELHKFVFEGGEKNKTLLTIADILEFLAEKQFSRSDCLLALGGGIVGDVTGFAASAYLRGIDFIQIPTTLLATVDSSVGGKTGVNLTAGKNLAGAFWQPSLVLFDPAVLSTLSDEIRLDGIAETVKAGVIADPVILEMMQDAALPEDPDFLMELAARAIAVKKKVVEEDERDHGSRQLLNLGHTIAHAIEKCSDYAITHGHAVAMGMKIVSLAAERLHWTEEPCAEQIETILKGFAFPLNCPYSAEELTEAALRDKKRRGGSITLVYPASIGDCRLKTIPVSELKDFIACGLNGQ